MQGSSRASLAVGRERLDAAASARGSEPMELADDLLAVTGLLDSHASLRRALTDPGRDGETRTAALAGLLAGKVSSGVARRWPASWSRCAGRTRATWPTRSSCSPSTRS